VEKGRDCGDQLGAANLSEQEETFRGLAYGQSPGVPKPGLKFHITAMVCQAAGGPEQYTGRSTKESHLYLNITEKEWETFVADFQETLDKFQVPGKEQNELLAIVESTKGDIVMSSPM